MLSFHDFPCNVNHFASAFHVSLFLSCATANHIQVYYSDVLLSLRVIRYLHSVSYDEKSVSKAPFHPI